MDAAGSIWQVALALLGIIAVVLVLGFIARRMQGGRSGGGTCLHVVDSAYLGPKERVVLVQLDDSQVLFAMNGQCITKLSERTGVAPLEPSAPESGGFAQLLNSISAGGAR